MAVRRIIVANVYRPGYRMEIIGDKAVRQRLQAIKVGMVKKFNRALKQEGDIIYDLSQNEVPFDSGALQRSGKVVDGYEGGDYVVAIGYGDESTNREGDETWKYARYQHETNPHSAKYLENPFNLMETGMVERIATRMRGVE